MTELHVIPDERTTWRVYADDASEPLSTHTNVTDAERAALTRADDRDAQRVVIHDRYHRTHDAAPSQAALRPARETPAPASSGSRENACASSPARERPNPATDQRAQSMPTAQRTATRPASTRPQPRPPAWSAALRPSQRRAAERRAAAAPPTMQR
jgi:hypothetical protein